MLLRLISRQPTFSRSRLSNGNKKLEETTMTDLVQRLREAANALPPPAPEPPHPLYGLMHEAAHEITRQEIVIHHLRTYGKEPGQD